MRDFIVSEKNEGQRLMRFVEKLLPHAPRSFLYRSFRKKNIVCNKKKCTGAEILAAGDVVRFWLSDETFDSFAAASEEERPDVDAALFAERIVYEDAELLIVKKPRGMPTQRDGTGKVSLNDELLSYVGEAAGMRPSVCHRLDRNTEGLVICGKTVRALQQISEWIAERKIRKWYRALVFGRTEETGKISKWLLKDPATNTVKVAAENTPGAVPAVTEFRKISDMRVNGGFVTEVEAELLTGRSHQIRVHFASIGHPLLGDLKYGTRESRAFSRRLEFSAQALSAAKIAFPETDGPLAAISGREFSIVPDFGTWWGRK